MTLTERPGQSPQKRLPRVCLPASGPRFSGASEGFPWGRLGLHLLVCLSCSRVSPTARPPPHPSPWALPGQASHRTKVWGDVRPPLLGHGKAGDLVPVSPPTGRRSAWPPGGAGTQRGGQAVVDRTTDDVGGKGAEAGVPFLAEWPGMLCQEGD